MSALIHLSAFSSRSSAKKGFTLIELMIAISIIAIISTVGLVTYSQAQSLARDARRKQDLKALAVALQLYKQQNGRYPCHTTSVNSTNPTSLWITDAIAECSIAAPAIPLGTNYIKDMPSDPKSNDALGNGTNTTLYGYSYTTPGSGCVSPYPTTAGQFYTLRTRLENKNDPDRCEIKQYKSCDNLVICRTGEDNKKDLFIITSE